MLDPALALRLFPLCIVLLLASCFLSETKTSANAKPSDVTFLNIPASARKIRYWHDPANKIAVFEISETEFLEMFNMHSYSFAEIEKPISYVADRYGDPNVYPWSGPTDTETESGLIYKKIAGGGGGVTVMYDRARGTAYYEWGKW